MDFGKEESEVFACKSQPFVKMKEDSQIRTESVKHAVETSGGRKKRPINSYFHPFETLGIEVSPLESIAQHMFYVGLEIEPVKTDTTAATGNSSLQDVRKETLKPTEDNSIFMNFTRERITEMENNAQVRVQRLLNMFPQPLHLTGNNKRHDTGEFTFTRFHQTLILEQSSRNLQKCPPDGSETAVVREVFYRSRTFSTEDLLKLEIVRVDDFDMLELRITEPAVMEEYRSLMTLMKAYYDITLINPRKERIPIERIQSGIIAVALISPFTSEAKFVRVRIGGSQKINVGEKAYRIFTVIGVDDGFTYSVPVEHLYYIDPDFMELPFMVNKYQLKGFDFFQGTQTISNTFGKLVNIKSSNFRGKLSSTMDKDIILCVELFLGKGDYEQNVNYLYLQELLRVLTPAVTSDRMMEWMDAQVCHCDSKANLWLHCENEILPKVLNFCKDELLCSHLKEETLESISEGILNGELFVARSLIDGFMYRARVEHVIFEQNKLHVEFIDWGNFETIDIAGVYRASALDWNYAAIPPQALKVRLEHVTEIPDVVKFYEVLKDLPLQVWDAAKSGDMEMKVKRVSCFIKRRNNLVPIREYMKSLSIHLV